tara:strand:+ start:486 stop:686 length:201 start_codon:yes stop_codon:yes gene_type:complete
MAELKRKQYIYTFVGGGWNTEWAKTKRGAIRQAKDRWKGNDKLVVNEQSFQIATDEMLRSAMSLFW